MLFVNNPAVLQSGMVRYHHQLMRQRGATMNNIKMENTSKDDSGLSSMFFGNYFNENLFEFFKAETFFFDVNLFGFFTTLEIFFFSLMETFFLM